MGEGLAGMQVGTKNVSDTFRVWPMVNKGVGPIRVTPLQCSAIEQWRSNKRTKMSQKHQTPTVAVSLFSLKTCKNHLLHLETM